LDDAEILNDLPHHLKTAVALYLNADIISNVPLFQDSVPGFIPSMSVHLKSQIYSPNEVIFHIGDIGREMYFINKGTVDIISRDGKLLASLSDGAYFGEIALLFQGRRTATGITLDIFKFVEIQQSWQKHTVICLCSRRKTWNTC
jgi:hypothetical protein